MSVNAAAGARGYSSSRVVTRFAPRGSGPAKIEQQLPPPVRLEGHENAIRLAEEQCAAIDCEDDDWVEEQEDWLYEWFLRGQAATEMAGVDPATAQASGLAGPEEAASVYSGEKTAPGFGSAALNVGPWGRLKALGSVGRLGKSLPFAARGGAGARKTFVAADGTEISGFTRHGINRAIGDGAQRAGVKPKALLDAIRNPRNISEGVDDLGRPFKVFQGTDARVVVNPETGQVVTTNPLSRFGANR